MIAALLFELEGVLVETAALRAEALVSALAADGIDLGVDEAFELTRARSVRRAVAAAAHAARVAYDLVAIDITASRAERRFAERAAAGGILLTDGAVEFVERAQSGARCAVVARGSRTEVDTLLRLAQLDGAFESVVTHEDVVEEKPAPASYRAALARLERRRALPRRSVVALEDGADGARSARAAGVVSLVVGPAPASDAVEADGYLPTLAGVTLESIRTIAARAGANVL